MRGQQINDYDILMGSLVEMRLCIAQYTRTDSLPAKHLLVRVGEMANRLSRDIAMFLADQERVHSLSETTGGVNLDLTVGDPNDPPA